MRPLADRARLVVRPRTIALIRRGARKVGAVPDRRCGNLILLQVWSCGRRTKHIRGIVCRSPRIVIEQL